MESGIQEDHIIEVNFEDTFFLENVIYNELISRGYEVFTGQTYKGEIDRFDYSRNGVGHINIVDFLLQKKDISLT